MRGSKRCFKWISQITGVVFGIYLCLRYASECSRGILNGILFCIEVLVPSLFFFMALSAYIVKSGMMLPMTKPFDRLTKKLFGLPYPALAVILLAVIGGYPIGARCAAMMYEQGQLTADQAKKTVYTAVCAGPGFLINFVGRAMLGCPDVGVLLLTAQTFSLLIIGFIIGKLIKTVDDTRVLHICGGHEGSLITKAVADASKATFNMCAMVVLCSALIEILSVMSKSPVVTDVLSAAVEITTGCCRMCGRYPLFIIAFFIGFGGISVHLQIFSGLDDLRISKGLFVLFRLMQGIITSGMTYILLMVFPIEISVFSTVDTELTAARSATLFGSAALVMCSLCFLGSITKIKLRR